MYQESQGSNGEGTHHACWEQEHYQCLLRSNKAPLCPWLPVLVGAGKSSTPWLGVLLQPVAVSQHVLHLVTLVIWFSLFQPPSILPAATNFGCIKQKQKSKDPV